MSHSRCLRALSWLLSIALYGHAAVDQSAPQANGGGPLEVLTALSHSGYTSSTWLIAKVDYVCVAEAGHQRSPLNIALVLDSSGSMAKDQKIKYTIEAARAVIENLSERDTVSLVAFNDKVTVLATAGRAVNKAFLFHRLEEVFPEGYTDISAGLLEGIAQIKSQSGEGQLRHVLLLTDGMANRGVTDPAAMRQIVTKAHADGIGFSTLGCGTEFNERRLTELAQAGGGRYTYIKSPEEIPTAFEEELQGLLSVAAQNVRLEVTVKGAHMTKANGQPFDKPTSSHSVQIGNVRSGERGLFVFKLKPSNFETGAAVEVIVRVTFDDPQAAQRMNREIREQVPFQAEGRPNAVEDVILYNQVLEALAAAEEAAKGLDIEQYKEAQASFDALYDRAHQHALQSQDQELLNQTFLLKHFMQEFSAAAQQGLMHSHRDARAKFEKEADYRRYLLQHHRAPVVH